MSARRGESKWFIRHVSAMATAMALAVAATPSVTLTTRPTAVLTRAVASTTVASTAGNGVWVEFQSGTPSRPIWSGSYWTSSNTPPTLR